MEKQNPYKSPEAELSDSSELDQRPPRDETRGRRAYLFQLFMIWIVLPALASYIIPLIGLGEGGVSERVRFDQNGNRVATGFNLDILYVWYLQIPLFIYYTRNRVLDTGLNPWFTAVFVLPVINIAMWFWPPKYK